MNARLAADLFGAFVVTAVVLTTVLVADLCERWGVRELVTRLRTPRKWPRLGRAGLVARERDARETDRGMAPTGPGVAGNGRAEAGVDDHLFV